MFTDIHCGKNKLYEKSILPINLKDKFSCIYIVISTKMLRDMQK